LPKPTRSQLWSSDKHGRLKAFSRQKSNPTHFLLTFIL
jgi:hypothetical protein